MKGVFKGFQIPIRRLVFVEVGAQVCGCAIADVLCVAVTSAKLLWCLLEPSQPHTAPSSCSCSRGHGAEQELCSLHCRGRENPGAHPRWAHIPPCGPELATHWVSRLQCLCGLSELIFCMCKEKKHVLQRIVSEMVHKKVLFAQHSCYSEFHSWCVDKSRGCHTAPSSKCSQVVLGTCSCFWS